MSGGATKTYTDALRVYEVQRGAMDEDYLTHWAGALGILQLMERLRGEAEPV